MGKGATRGVLVALAIGLATAGPARAASVDAVTMFSDQDEWVGQGAQRVFTPGTGEVGVTGSTSDLTVSVSGGTRGDAFSLEFAAPPGQTLAPGVYDKAQRASLREAGHPGIDIRATGGHGCNTVGGRFEVKALDVTPAGVVQRLWIVYEHHCEGGTWALFGEVRLGVASGGGPIAVAPSVVRWPLIDAGDAGTAVPVTVMATERAEIGSAAIAGAHPGDFTERVDECSGRTLTAGETCEIWVRFVPTTPGTRTAQLRIPVGDVTHVVALQGFDYGGRTRLVMHSDEHDFVGQGKDWSYRPENASITADGSRQHVGFRVDGDTGDWWYGDFAPASGDILVPGETYPATRYLFSNGGAGMTVDGNGRGCQAVDGTFTVTEARYEADGSMRSVGIDFEQHCEHSGPALHGTFEFRAGDTTTPPPWTVAGLGTTGPGTGLGNPSSSPPPTRTPAPVAPRQAALCASIDARVLRGGRRADRIAGTRRSERILGRAGRDRVLARGGDDCVDGGAGRDRLYGGQGADLLAGGSGRDSLFGGAGDDILVGGSGRDRLDCGPGRFDVARGVRRGERVRGCERITRAR